MEYFRHMLINSCGSQYVCLCSRVKWSECINSDEVAHHMKWSECAKVANHMKWSECVHGIEVAHHMKLSECVHGIEVAHHMK